MILILGIIFLIFCVYTLGVKPYGYWKSRKIPYVTPWPLFGNLGPVIFRKTNFPYLLQDIYNAYPNKRYVGFYQFLSPTLLLRDPELIKQLNIKEFDSFSEHRVLATEDVDPLWGKSLISITDINEWQAMRSILSPSFTSSKMKLMFPLMKVCATQFTSYYGKQMGTVNIEMKNAFSRLMNDVIATTAFGVSCNSLEQPNNEFYVHGRGIVDFSGIRTLKMLLNTISPFIMKMFGLTIFSASVNEFFRKIIKETITVRENQKIFRPDMIHLLMEARKGQLKYENEEQSSNEYAVLQESDLGKNFKTQKKQLTDDDITAQALLFYLAGLDTITSVMCFVCYELALNEEIQTKLKSEIEELLEDNTAEFTYDILHKMKYLDMVISEALRKWPPTLATDRMSSKPFTLEPQNDHETSVHLDVGTNIWTPVYPLHHDPNYFPDPEKFDPERFSDENKRHIKPFTYIPFGVGPKSCIGSRFAIQTCKVILVEILRKFEIFPTAKTQIPVIIDKTSATTFPENGMWLGFK